MRSSLEEAAAFVDADCGCVVVDKLSTFVIARFISKKHGKKARAAAFRVNGLRRPEECSCSLLPCRSAALHGHDHAIDRRVMLSIAQLC